MRNRIVVLALASLAMAACSTDKVSVATAGAVQIIVEASNAVPTVSQSLVSAGSSKKSFEWAVGNAYFSGFFFRTGGIVGDGSTPATVPPECRGKTVGKFSDAFTCTPPAALSGRSIACERVVNVYEPDTCYKYAVILTNKGNTKPLDPWIKNN